MPAETNLLDVFSPMLAVVTTLGVVATAVILVVGLIALVLTFMTLRAYRSSGNRKVLWVLWAFALFAAKSAFLIGGILAETDAMLLFTVGGAIDLVIVILLITPFFR